jgi:hypothetical protein
VGGVCPGKEVVVRLGYVKAWGKVLAEIGVAGSERISDSSDEKTV